MDQHAAPESAPDLANERVLALELFNQVLEKLDEDLIQAFVLFELQQLSKNEVAAQLGIPPGTAASRRRRARQTVEATLARLGKVEQSPVRIPRPSLRAPASLADVSVSASLLASVPPALGAPPLSEVMPSEAMPSGPMRSAPVRPAPVRPAPVLAGTVPTSVARRSSSAAVPLLKVPPTASERRVRLA